MEWGDAQIVELSSERSLLVDRAVEPAEPSSQPPAARHHSDPVQDALRAIVQRETCKNEEYAHARERALRVAAKVPRNLNVLPNTSPLHQPSRTDCCPRAHVCVGRATSPPTLLPATGVTFRREGEGRSTVLKASSARKPLLLPELQSSPYWETFKLDQHLVRPEWRAEGSHAVYAGARVVKPVPVEERLSQFGEGLYSTMFEYKPRGVPHTLYSRRSQKRSQILEMLGCSTEEGNRRVKNEQEYIKGMMEQQLAKRSKFKSRMGSW